MITLWQLKTDLRAGCAQVKSLAQEFRRECLTPLVKEAQEFAEEIHEEFERNRDALQTFEQNTFPRWWNTIQHDAYSAIQSVQQDVKKTFVAVQTRQTEMLQQMQPDSEAQQIVKKLADNEIDRHLIIGTATLACAIGGFFYAPLNLLCIIGLIYISLPMHKRVFELLKAGKVTVHTLVSVVIIGAILSGYFFLASLSGLLFRFSQKLLLRVTDDSRGRLLHIFQQTPQCVWVEVNGVEVEIPFQHVKMDDRVILNSGETIPVDGRVVEGLASIDQHLLTGEARPVEKGPGDAVLASTVILSGRIIIQVEATGCDTKVAQIERILNQTVEFKSTVELRVRTMANRTAAPTLLLAGAALPFLGPSAALGIINSHFRDQMELIAPISILNTFAVASHQGILLKDGRSLDLFNQVDTIVFDKTGTLTQEQPTVGDIYPCEPYHADEILRLAAAAEFRQTHPIAKAVVQAAIIRHLVLPTIEDANYQIGYGLSVAIDGNVIQVGSHRFMEMTQIAIPAHIAHIQSMCYAQGHSLILVAVNRQLAGAIELLPTIRPEASEVIRRLRQRSNIRATYIISGDHEAPTRILAEQLGMDGYFSNTLPEQKAQLIHQLRQDGRYVCYIGDGINDAIAMKASHVSISLRGASNVATDTAQIILLDKGIWHLQSVFELAQRFQRNLNITFALILTSTLLGISSVFFLGWGFANAIWLNLGGLMAGTINAMTPLRFLRHPPEQPMAERKILSTHYSTDKCPDYQRPESNRCTDKQTCLPLNNVIVEQ